MNACTMLLAWIIEAMVGWPDTLYRRIRHPVVWIGWVIRRLEGLLNRESFGDGWRTLTGALAASTVVLVVWAAASSLTGLLPAGLWGLAVQAIIAASLLASRSLYEHVAAVAELLASGSIAASRNAVSHIVGRNSEQLDEAGIARAALESLAENTSDAVIAPLFWGVLLGLPGVAAYKAVNTLDSMIGHRTERHLCFGKFAARLDDAANWLPARLTGLLLVLVADRRADAWYIMRRDAHAHRSVNAGWPEAAMAGALAVRLSGPRCYGDAQTDEPWLNAGAPDPDAGAVSAGLSLYLRAMYAAAAVLAVLTAALAFL